jgi:Tol biopolymer transport system component
VTTIFTRPAGGSAPARRILTPEFDVDVDASPDGSRIAFTSVRPYSTSGVYVADADGGNESFLHPGEGPDWSPDGTRILVRSAGALYAVNSDGSLPIALPEPAGHDFAEIEAWRWDPVNAQVSFVSQGGTPCADIYTMNLDGTNVMRQTRPECSPQVFDFDWLPGGPGALVFAGYPCRFPPCRPTIYGAVTPDGWPVALLSASPFLDHPRVAPAGDSLIFVRYGDFSQTAIWTMSILGEGERQLTPMGTGTAPAWLPSP